MKIATTKERILQFIDYKQISKQKFFEQTKLKRGFLDGDKLSSSIPDTFLAIIIATYPELQLEWLITGKGDMVKEKNVNQSIIGDNNQLAGVNINGALNGSPTNVAGANNVNNDITNSSGAPSELVDIIKRQQLQIDKLLDIITNMSKK